MLITLPRSVAVFVVTVYWPGTVRRIGNGTEISNYALSHL